MTFDSITMKFTFWNYAVNGDEYRLTQGVSDPYKSQKIVKNAKCP